MKKNKFIMNTKPKMDEQLRIIDKASNKAIKQVEFERKINKSNNYIVEWFRYIELTSNQLKKYLN
jgi:hypothetical protein